LYKQIIYGCKISKPIECIDDGGSKEHGRLERRTYEVFDPAVFLKKWPEWSEIKRVIRVTRFRQPTHSSKTREPHSFYYASNTCLEGEVFAQAIRKYGWCENKNHYIRDTAFCEDNTTKRLGAFNFCVLLSTAMNILRTTQCQNIRKTLFENSMNFKNIENYIHLFVG
jgi:hypothetical protein